MNAAGYYALQAVLFVVITAGVGSWLFTKESE